MVFDDCLFLHHAQANESELVNGVHPIVLLGASEAAQAAGDMCLNVSTAAASTVLLECLQRRWLCHYVSSNCI